MSDRGQIAPTPGQTQSVCPALLRQAGQGRGGGMSTRNGRADRADTMDTCEGPLTRRSLLLGLGAGLALGPVRVAFGQGSGEARFCVVLLRGALDGLSAVPAYGDASFASLRGPLAQPEPGREGGVLDLGGRFGLHPRLSQLHAMYRANEALVLHAVAGPWRTRRWIGASSCSAAKSCRTRSQAARAGTAAGPSVSTRLQSPV